MKFAEEKKGYNVAQVDSYVCDLEMQLSNALTRVKTLEQTIADIQQEHNTYQEKSKNISVALTAAVEKARQIEASSKNVYKLKIQQLEILYKRWESLLYEMLEKYPNVKDVDNVKQIMNEFKSSIKNTLKEDFKLTSFSVVNTNNDPIRILLSKMNEHFKSAEQIKSATIERKPINKDLKYSQSELERMEEKAPIIKPIYDKQLEHGEKFETLADKFLREEPEEDVYAQKFGANSYPKTNESGFDLKEAVNPKEDLSEIMKAFDFYKDDEE